MFFFVLHFIDVVLHFIVCFRPGSLYLPEKIFSACTTVPGYFRKYWNDFSSGLQMDLWTALPPNLPCPCKSRRTFVITILSMVSTISSLFTMSIMSIISFMTIMSILMLSTSPPGKVDCTASNSRLPSLWKVALCSWLFCRETCINVWSTHLFAIIKRLQDAKSLLESVRMLGACQQCWFATMDFAIGAATHNCPWKKLDILSYMRSELMLMLPNCTILLDICAPCDVLLENLAVLRGSCHPSSIQTCLGEQIRNCPHFNLLTISTFATSHFNNFFWYYLRSKTAGGE